MEMFPSPSNKSLPSEAGAFRNSCDTRSGFYGLVINAFALPYFPKELELNLFRGRGRLLDKI